MKYYVMPAGIWAVFCKPFRRNLVAILGFDPEEAKVITKKSRRDYKSLIHRMPEFEKGDFLKINTISCAMLSCFICNMPKRPSVEKVTEFSREITMPEGAPYCDCVYRRKNSQSI